MKRAGRSAARQRGWPAAYRDWGRRPASPGRQVAYLEGIDNPRKEIQMPVILWLLGVPLLVIVALMLFGVL